MANQIDNVRAEIEKYFNPALVISDAHEAHVSPGGNYLLDIDVYTTDDPERNWCISAAVVTEQRTGNIVAKIRRNDDSFFHAWVERDGTEYLLCSEDLEGQTVIDLTHCQVASYRSDDDLFIWTEFYPSPRKRKLAVVGCYWACPFAVAVYDFGDPLNLPLKCLKMLPLTGGDVNFDVWMDEDTFSLKDANGKVQIHPVL